MDRHIPGFEPSYVRIEFEHVPTEGWQVAVTEADDPAFVQRSGRTFYGPVTWDEAIQIAADTLDCIIPAGRGQEPF